MQIDGCEHWWFEDRGPQCTLLVFVDDATSRDARLSGGLGKPVAFYSDKHGVFRVNLSVLLSADAQPFI